MLSYTVLVESATGIRPVGFRAPGYTSTRTVFDALELESVAYDSSVFPCPAYYGAKAAAIGGTTFLVEDFVPERIEVDLAAPEGPVAAGGKLSIDVDAQYLYGAPAAGLALEGETVIKPAKEVPGFAGYSFGLDDDQLTPERAPLVELPLTGPDGRATVTATLPTLAATTRPLEAEVTVRVRQASGRAVEERITRPVAPSGPMIGVQPLLSGDQVSEGATAGSEVIAIGPSGARIDLAGARWELLKVNRRFQWYRDGSSWTYEPIVSTQRVANGTVDLTTGDTARISAAVDWGSYRLEVTDPGSATTATSVTFSAGRVSPPSHADTPDRPEVGPAHADHAPDPDHNQAPPSRPPTSSRPRSSTQR